MDSPWLEYRLSGLNLVGRPCYWILRMSVVIYRLVEWFCLVKAGNHAVSTHKHSPTALLLHFIHLSGDKLTVKRSSPFTLKTQQTLSDFIQSGVVLLTYNLFSLKCPFTEKIPIFSVKTKLRSIIIQSLHLEKETLKKVIFESLCQWKPLKSLIFTSYENMSGLYHIKLAAT